MKIACTTLTCSIATCSGSSCITWDRDVITGAGENLGLGPQTRTLMSLPAPQTHRTRRRAPTGCSVCHPEASFLGGVGWDCQPKPAWTTLSCPRPLPSAEAHFGLFALEKRKTSQEKVKPEGNEPTENLEVGVEPWNGVSWKGAQDSAEMASTQSLFWGVGGWGSYFVNWFRIGKWDFFVFNLPCFLGRGWGETTGYSVPRGQSGRQEHHSLFGLGFWPFFLCF